MYTESLTLISILRMWSSTLARTLRGYSVFDFDLSVRVKDEETTVKGYGGSPTWLRRRLELPMVQI
jgi:hypothetical protein